MTFQLQNKKRVLAFLLALCLGLGAAWAHGSRASDEETEYMITVSAYPETGGVVTGGGVYQEFAECTLVATANDDYSFVNWTENDSVVCTTCSYSFLVTGNRTLEANFVEKGFTVSFDPGSGSCAVTTLTEFTWHSGIVLPVAVPPASCAAQGYVFSGWSAEVVEGANIQPEVLVAGSVYFPQDSVTLYAVYGNVQGGWEQVRSLVNGEEVCLVSNEYKVEFNIIHGSYLVGTSSSFTDAPSGLHPFTVLIQDDGVSCLLMDHDGKYLCKTTNTGSLSLSDNITSSGIWMFEMINGNIILRNTSHASNHQLVAKTMSSSVGKVFACVPYPEGLGAGNTMIQLYHNTMDIYSSYDHAPCIDCLQTPVIKPIAEGLFLDPVTVGMFTTDPDAQIHFTLDGSTPTINSLAYSASFPPVMRKTGTVSARLFKNGVGGSVQRQTYHFPMEYTSIAAFKAAADDSQIVKINREMRVTKQYGRYLYVTDESGSLMLYDEYGFVTNTFVDGDEIQPVQGRYKNVDGQPMMVLYHSVGKTGANIPVEPVTLTVQEANGNFTALEAELVKFERVHFSGSTANFGTANNLNVVQDNNSIRAVDRFDNVNCAISAGATYDVIGILGLEGGVKSIFPRANSDILRYYSIACNAVGGGSLSASVNTAIESTVITVNPVPGSGRHLESLYYYSTNPNVRTEIDTASMQFVMPAVNITVVAVFAVNVNFTVSLYKGSGLCDVTALTEGSWHSGVVLPAAAPSPACAMEGYSFVGWSENYINEVVECPDLFLAGDTYYPTENTMLYAVYALGSTEWHHITNANDIIEGKYIVSTKRGNIHFYLPYEGVKNNPKAKRTYITSKGIPVDSTELWTFKRITEGPNPQYSITYTRNDTTFYLKGRKDANAAIQVTMHDPGSGWVFSNHGSYGLMAHFPNPVEDPAKSDRYLGLYWNGVFNSQWWFLSEALYGVDGGELQFYMFPPSTYKTEPVCEFTVEDPWFMGLPEGIIFGDSFQVGIAHPDASVSIYYTLDGSDPTSNSTLYTGPFYIYGDCTVKAVAVDAYGNSSAIILHDFEFRYAIVCDTALSGGQISASQAYAKAGAVVVLTIIPQEDYTLESIVVTDCHGQEVEVIDERFVMPGCSVFVTGSFVQTVLTHSIALNPGWSWFSSYLEYPSDAMEQLESSIASNNVSAIIKSPQAFNQLSDGIWIGEVVLQNEMMYMVSLSDSVTYTLEGDLVVPEEHPITLSQEGWTWISFLSPYSMDLAEALSSVYAFNGDQIKNEGSFSTYSAATGWVGGVNTLEPGKGYMYYNAGLEAHTLIYPSSGRMVPVSPKEQKHWSGNHQGFATNLSMMVTLDAEAVTMGEGSHEIGAFVNGECRGSALLQLVGDRYVAFLTVSGEADEEVCFRLFDTRIQEEYAGVADERLSYEADAIIGSLKAPMTLHFRGTGLNDNDAPKLFPNPARDKVVLSGHGIEMVKVYNTLGQLLYSEACDSVESIELNLSSFSAGVYTVHVRLGNGQQIHQIIVKE